MPLVDYGCRSCGQITERLIRSREIPDTVECKNCGSEDTIKQVSLFHHKMYSKPKYNEQFVEKSLPFLRSQKGIDADLAEGKGSEESRAARISESIGTQIDRVIEKGMPKI